SEANGRHVVNAGKHYLFHIANENQHQYQMAEELLAHSVDAAVITDVRNVKRSIRLFRVNTGLPKNETYVDSIFSHAQTLLRVHSEWRNQKDEIENHTRYFV